VVLVLGTITLPRVEVDVDDDEEAMAARAAAAAAATNRLERSLAVFQSAVVTVPTACVAVDVVRDVHIDAIDDDGRKSRLFEKAEAA
jgi:hypothetical protein